MGGCVPHSLAHCIAHHHWSSVEPAHVFWDMMRHENLSESCKKIAMRVDVALNWNGVSSLADPASAARLLS
eukprot:COSAG02_NODE_213_length_28704_cov_69.390177_10_plen_71_part_00